MCLEYSKIICIFARECAYEDDYERQDIYQFRLGVEAPVARQGQFRSLGGPVAYRRRGCTTLRHRRRVIRRGAEEGSVESEDQVL